MHYDSKGDFGELHVRPFFFNGNVRRHSAWHAPSAVRLSGAP